MLLIHDLGDTPYEMRGLGQRFAAACYLVRAILLPGHGTVPGDLLAVDHRAWVEATRLGVASFAGQAERVYWSASVPAPRSRSTMRSAKRASRDPVLAGLVLLAPALARPGGILTLARSYLGYRGARGGGGLREDTARSRSGPLLVDDAQCRAAA